MGATGGGKGWPSRSRDPRSAREAPPRRTGTPPGGPTHRHGQDDEDQQREGPAGAQALRGPVRHGEDGEGPGRAPGPGLRPRHAPPAPPPALSRRRGHAAAAPRASPSSLRGRRRRRLSRTCSRSPANRPRAGGHHHPGKHFAGKGKADDTVMHVAHAGRARCRTLRGLDQQPARRSGSPTSRWNLRSPRSPRPRRFGEGRRGADGAQQPGPRGRHGRRAELPRRSAAENPGANRRKASGW